jgi:hypothetical protein
MHDLDEHRVQPSGQSTKVLAKLSQSKLACHVVLATVKGDAVSPPEAQYREKQLEVIIRKNPAAGGSKTCQFTRTKDSAWDIVDTILLSQRNPIKLRLIQEELSKIYNPPPLVEPFAPKPRRPQRGLFSFLFSWSKSRRVS